MKKVISILPVLLLILVSCQDKKAKPDTAILQSNMESGQSNIALVEKLLAEGDNKNPSFLDEIADPDYKYYLPSNNTPLNLEEHKQFWASVNQSFPDLKHSVQDIFAVEDKVVARTVVSGTHQEEFAGIPATGNSAEISQILICRFKNGKLVEMREEVNMLGLYQQLGMEMQPKQ